MAMLRTVALTSLISQMAVSAAPVEPSIDVVLAHYDEPLHWLATEPSIASPKTRVKIYSKNKSAAEKLSIKLPITNAELISLPNVGRESHTFLAHIVAHYDDLAPWTVFSQASRPSFGYKGHRTGGGHLLAGDTFGDYLKPSASGSRFVYTAALQITPSGSDHAFDHALRADYVIDDDTLPTAGIECPTEAAGWTQWWKLGWFADFVTNKARSQHGEQPLDFYRKYIDPSHPADQAITLQFPQGARFAASRKVIHRRPKADYEAILATLARDVDPYSGYYMEWMWPALFLGERAQPCDLPSVAQEGVPHAIAMDDLMARFVPGYASSHPHATGEVARPKLRPQPVPRPSPQPSPEPSPNNSPDRPTFDLLDSIDLV